MIVHIKLFVLMLVLCLSYANAYKYAYVKCVARENRALVLISVAT